MKKVTLTYEEFWKHTEDDAYNWFYSGWKAKDITEQDILNEIPEEYWQEKPEEEMYEDERNFTPEEYASQVLSFMQGFEEEEEEQEQSDED